MDGCHSSCSVSHRIKPTDSRGRGSHHPHPPTPAPAFGCSPQHVAAASLTLSSSDMSAQRQTQPSELRKQTHAAIMLHLVSCCRSQHWPCFPHWLGGRWPAGDNNQSKQLFWDANSLRRILCLCTHVFITGIRRGRAQACTVIACSHWCHERF